MKKRIMSVLLALCLVLELTPVGARAAEQLPAPTELKWGISYGDSGSLQDAETIPGAVSWKAGGDHATEFLLEFYQEGEVGAYIPSLIIAAEQMEFYSDLYFLSSDPETGNYYFTVTAKGDGVNYSDSGSARSETWAYKRPNAQLDQVTVGSWDTLDQKPVAFWTALSSENVFSYEIELFFSSVEDGNYSCVSSISSNEADSEWVGVTFPDQAISTPGFYKYRVRAISSDITKYQNGPWSEMSQAYHLESATPPEPSKIELVKSMFTVDTAPETYDGLAKTKVITSSLTLGTDYTVSYSNNVNVGTATITITGKGNYSGKVTYTFEITSDITASIWLATHSITLVKGRRASPVVRVTPSDSIITWISSDSSIASVDNTGSITGLKGGTAQITASITYGGKTVQESCMVTVASALSIKFAKGNVHLEPGQSTNMAYTYRSEGNSRDHVTLTSSNPSVATVTQQNLKLGCDTAIITAVGAGEAKITATIREFDGETKTATCIVTVGKKAEEIAQDFVAKAKSYAGSSRGDLGYTNDWCARFVGRCAKEVGAGNVIPDEGSCIKLYKRVIECGGSGVYFDTIAIRNNGVPNEFKIERSNYSNQGAYTPQKGDLVIMLKYVKYKNGDWIPLNNNWTSHVEIVKAVDEKNKRIYLVGGNAGIFPGVVKDRETPISYTGSVFWSGKDNNGNDVIYTIAAIARPQWSKANTSADRGTKIDEYHCPIDVRYTYDGEVLDSTTGQLEASFGTMELNEVDDSIKVTLYDYYDVDVEITGNGEGTMDLTTTFEDEDGTTSTRSFQNVPISSDTVGKLYSTDSVATAYLELYENQGADFVEVWTADKNETATQKNAELTDWYTSDNDFGDDEPTPTPTPPSGGGGSSSWDDDDDDRPSTPSKTPVPTVTPAPTASPDPTVVAAADRFTDVKPTDWFADAVQYVCDKGMMNGTTKNIFSPNAPTSRGMLITILYRLEEEPSVSAAVFSDVASGKYYAKAVAWASQNGLVNGFEDGSFRPDEPVTREQIAAILYRYTAYKGGDVIARGDLRGFTDATQISGYAREPLAWAKAKGLINGTDWGGIHPGGYATRAETATILMRFCKNVIK